MNRVNFLPPYPKQEETGTYSTSNHWAGVLHSGSNNLRVGLTTRVNSGRAQGLGYKLRVQIISPPSKWGNGKGDT